MKLLFEITLEQYQESVTDSLLDCFRTHDYKSYIQSSTLFDNEAISKTPVEEIKKSLLNSEQTDETFMYGLACLQAFVAENWGSETSDDVSQFFPWISKEAEDRLLDDMVGDGDSIIVPARLPVLLAVARIILVDGHRNSAAGAVHKLWACRCALTVQAILEERSMQIYNFVTEVLNEAKVATGEAELKALILLEEAKFDYTYYLIKECELATEAACKSLGLNINDTGALGKRTRFQTKDVAQFTLDLAEHSHYEKREEQVDSQYLPQDLQLNDEVRLESIQFQDKARENVRQLDSLQQCALLSRYFLKERNLPVDDISWQELMPHLNMILQHPVSWSTHVTALFHRCKLESKARRTVERARAQLETILESYNDANIPRSVRMKNIYISRLPARWAIQKELGSILLSLGATKSALDLYLKLESWDEVIVCYNLLQLRHKAAEIIKDRLEQKESARLWCQLGDATDDIQHYHKALQISNNKSARAYKSLGLHYYFRKNYSESMIYFKKSLECSKFQLDVLLRLGFASMECEDWSSGAQAYRDYCSLESDNFEAWNNLANCYIKLGQKERAWRVLQEAVRCDFDNWKVWDNLMVISTDLGAFDECIRAYNRVLDIKKTHIDEQVLNILASAVINNLKDSTGDESCKYRPQLVKLLARLTVAQPREPVPWRSYGNILLASSEDDTESQVKGCQCLQKSLAAYTGKKGWDKDLTTVKSVLETSRQIIQGILSVKSDVQQLQLGNSARLTLVSSLKLVERSQTNINTGLLDSTIRDSFTEVQDDVDKLLSRIEQIKAGQ